MATQYTAGLTTGQVLTAATMNQIGAVWETYTPTVTASSGTFTTLTINSARWARIQKLIWLTLDLSVTAIGTAANELRFTVPTGLTAISAQRTMGYWREVAVSGETGVVQGFSTTNFEMRRYDNGAYLTNGDRYYITIFYEAG